MPADEDDDMDAIAARSVTMQVMVRFLPDSCSRSQKLTQALNAGDLAPSLAPREPVLAQFWRQENDFKLLRSHIITGSPEKFRRLRQKRRNGSSQKTLEDVKCLSLMLQLAEPIKLLLQKSRYVFSNFVSRHDTEGFSEVVSLKTVLHLADHVRLDTIATSSVLDFVCVCILHCSLTQTLGQSSNQQGLGTRPAHFHK